MTRFFALLLILTFFFPSAAFGANTHSVDLERGSSQYLSRTDSAVFTSDDWALDMVIKPESLPTNNNSNYVSAKLLGGSGDAAEFHLRLRNAAGTHQVVCAWQDGVNPAFEVVYTSTTPTATWTQYRCTKHRSSGRMTIYAFGVDVATAVQNTGATPNTDRSFAIGYADYGGAAEFYDGLVDEVRIWNTVSPTVAWNECATGGESGLVARWGLDNVLTDSGPNALTLTNNNAAVFSTDVAPFLSCGSAAGGSGTTKWFLNRTGPLFEFFLLTYYNPLVIIASAFLVLALFVALLRMYQAFRDWYRKNDMGWRL